VDCFFRPAAATIGGLRGERFAKKMGGGPSNGINSGLGVGDPSVAMKIAFRLVHAQSIVLDSNI
jgi:hypothetical protein